MISSYLGAPENPPKVRTRFCSATLYAQFLKKNGCGLVCLVSLQMAVVVSHLTLFCLEAHFLNKDERTRTAVWNKRLFVSFSSLELFVLQELMFHFTNVVLELFKSNLN